MTPLLLIAALSVGAADVQVETLDGHKVTGQLIAWTAESLTVAADGKQHDVPLAKLLRVRPQATAASPVVAEPIRVDLVDGSHLFVSHFGVRNEVATVGLAGNASLEIAAISIAAVHLKPPTEAIDAQWDEIRRLDATGDVLIIRKGDYVDFLEGIVGEISDETVHFRLQDEDVPVRRSKVDGVLYYRRSGGVLPKPICWMIGRDGSRVALRRVTLHEGQFRIEGTTGMTWTPPEGLIERFDFSAGKVVYLSDLTPQSTQWRPFFDLPAAVSTIRQFGSPRRDAALEGGPLRLEGKAYAKGLALRSRSEVTYRLPEPFRVLSAIAGIDDRMGDRGHVRLIVRGDGRILFDATLSGRDPPQPLQINIEGVRRLTILVDYGEDLDVADHLDLANARISK